VEHTDPDDPFSSTSKIFTGFVSASASHLQNTETGRLSPESGLSDLDDGAGGSTAPVIGFTSASNLSNTSIRFASASALLGGPVSATRRGSPSPQQSQNFADQTHNEGRFECTGDDASVNPLSMFTSFGKKKDLFQPSAAAVRAALERAKRWEAEDDTLLVAPPDADKHTDVEIPQRQALLSVENLSQRSTVPGQTVSGPANAPSATPGPTSVSHHVGFSSASRVETAGTFRSATYSSTPSAALGKISFQTPSVSNIKGKTSVKPFKSPLLNRSAMRSPGNRQSLPSLLNPATSTPARENRLAALNTSALPAVVPTPEARFMTPIPNRSTPVRKVPARKFVTPFKPGMRPGEPGHAQLKVYDAERVDTTSGPSIDDVQSTSELTRKSTGRRFFDLSTL
jgi:hypothetical protein